MERTIPSLHHPEIENLYRYGFNIPPEIVETILALPKETLLADLTKVLDQAVDDFEDYEQLDWDNSTMWFPFHAVMLLGYTGRPEALDILFRHFSESDEILEFWYNDWFLEDFWIPVYHLGRDRLEQLLAFATDDTVQAPYGRHPALNAVTQLYLHHPERREELLAWFERLFKHLLPKKDDPSEADTNLFTSAVADLIDLQGHELLPLIQPAFDTELYDPGMAGHWKDYLAEFRRPAPTWAKRDPFPRLTDWYAKAYAIIQSNEESDRIREEQYLEKQAEREAKTAKALEKFVQKNPQHFTSTLPKVGRNDPCPCGSGKKYKKCCGR